MTSYWLRQATALDLAAVRNLTRRVGRELQLGIRVPSGREGELIWVVEAGRGEIVGCCGIAERADGRWEVSTLTLAPEWRGLGLGRALLANAVAVARSEGAVHLALSVPVDSPAVETLARALGFREEPGGRGNTRRLALRLSGPS